MKSQRNSDYHQQRYQEANSTAMTKYTGKRRYSNAQEQVSEGFIDRIYHSFSVDFWLITASLVLVTNWFLHPASTVATILMVVGASLGGFIAINSNPRIARALTNFIRDNKKTGIWTLVLGLIVGITVFNFMTSPSDALILNTAGSTALKKLLGGSGSSAAAGFTAVTAATTVGSTNSGVDTMIDNMMLVFKALFFVGFMWALYKAYDKYTQQSELQDIIQTPLVLLIVVGIIDGAASVFLGA
jgi:hypothetical protein